MEKEATQIAILGAGIFVRSTYIPILAEISHLFTLKAISSRTEESARGAVEIAQKHFLGVICKWGDVGLDEIIQDDSIIGVAVVLAGQKQLKFFIAFPWRPAEAVRAQRSQRKANPRPLENLTKAFLSRSLQLSFLQRTRTLLGLIIPGNAFTLVSENLLRTHWILQSPYPSFLW